MPPQPLPAGSASKPPPAASAERSCAWLAVGVSAISDEQQARDEGGRQSTGDADTCKGSTSTATATKYACPSAFAASARETKYSCRRSQTKYGQDDVEAWVAL